MRGSTLERILLPASGGGGGGAPAAHHLTHESGGSDEITLAQTQVTGLAIALSGKVDTSDARLTDARTPAAHAASHGSGGTDAITVAQSQVTGLGTALAAKADLTGAAFTGALTITLATAATAGVSLKVTGDAQQRHIVLADGTHQWGTGAAAVDTNLYRSAVGQLKTDGELVAAAALTVGTSPAAAGALRLANAALAAWRNAAGNGDGGSVTVDSSNRLAMNATGGLLFQYAGGSKLIVDSGGIQTALGTNVVLSGGSALSLADGSHLVLATGTGTKIGTSTTQKLAFYNATPIVQPANTVALDDLVVNLGLRASGGAATFTTSVTSAGGSFVSTAGSLSLTSSNGIVNINAAAGNPQIFFNGGGVEYARWNGSGYLQMAESRHIQFGTASGSKIGTTASQKLAFYGAAPIIQPAGWSAPTGTLARTTFSSDTATLTQVAQRLAALTTDLIALGLIGA